MDVDDRGLGFAIPAAAAAQFWKGVQVGGPDECWPYVPDQPGRRSRRGRYGHVRIHFLGHDVVASRVAFVLGGGIIDNEVVAHSCDNPECMFPDHLFCVSVLDNVRQRDERNRRTPFLPVGEEHWSAKLREREVASIRRARELGVGAEVLAGMWGVSRATIYNIWAGKHYSTSQGAAQRRAAAPP